MKDLDIITVNDGEREIDLYIVATFSIEDQYYACLETMDEEELYLLKMAEDGQDIVFEVIDDEEEFDDAVQAYQELVEEQDSDLNS